MDEKQYLELKATLALERQAAAQAADQAHKTADAQYQEDLKAINRVWEMVNKGSPLPSSINSHADAVEHIRGFWRKVAHQLVEQMPIGTEFTVKDIQQAIAKRDPNIKTYPTTMSIYLNGLVQDGEIEVTRARRGRSAGVFKKRPTQPDSTPAALPLFGTGLMVAS